MGAAKYNPTAQAAKRGELPPKPRKMSKRAQRLYLAGLVERETGLCSLIEKIGGKEVYR